MMVTDIASPAIDTDSGPLTTATWVSTTGGSDASVADIAQRPRDKHEAPAELHGSATLQD
jgi:hypothetical protein